MNKGTVYLIPTFLYEDAVETIPTYVVDAIKNCTVFLLKMKKLPDDF
jgi:16S rRNA (cytidine1402-2'-O)-methyltransferase